MPRGNRIFGYHAAVSRLRILKDAAGAPDGLVVHEIYASLQGESTWAGLPCGFVRLSACHLRCTWCDTPHAFDEGVRRTLDDVVQETHALGTKLIEITGGEPLLQPGVYPLMARLADLGHTVLLETSGSLDVSKVDPRVIKIVDVKCPGSGEVGNNRWENLSMLGPRDEIKFVLADRADYEWARDVIRERKLENVLLSVAHGLLAPADVARWMLEDKLDARFQLQMHKVIWDPTARGV